MKRWFAIYYLTPDGTPKATTCFRYGEREAIERETYAEVMAGTAYKPPAGAIPGAPVTGYAIVPIRAARA